MSRRFSGSLETNRTPPLLEGLLEVAGSEKLRLGRRVVAVVLLWRSSEMILRR